MGVAKDAWRNPDCLFIKASGAMVLPDCGEAGGKVRHRDESMWMLVSQNLAVFSQHLLPQRHGAGVVAPLIDHASQIVHGAERALVMNSKSAPPHLDKWHQNLF